MNIQDPVICEQKSRRHQTCDNCLSNGPIACSRLKIVSMNRKYHNHKLQTNPWHCEEESHNHETLGRQTKQRKPALNTASCDENHSTTAYRGIIMFHNIKKKSIYYIHNPGRHTYKAHFFFLFLKWTQMTGFRNAQLNKQNKNF